jgi:AcrR family transcriptional regulator
MSRTRRVVSMIKDSRKIQDRRELLVAAAMKIFLRQGFHTATVREIGAAAGLTQGTIYNYVRSKSDILYLVCDQSITAYQDAVRGALAGILGPARLEAAIRAIVEAVYAHQDQILVMHHVTLALDRRSLKAILARIQAFNEFVGDILSQCGDERMPINQCLAVNVITFLPSITALRRWDLRHVSFQELSDGLTTFIVRGLGLDSAVLKAAPVRTVGATELEDHRQVKPEYGARESQMKGQRPGRQS